MNENVAQQNQLSPLVSLQNKVNVETEKGLQQTCMYFKIPTLLLVHIPNCLSFIDKIGTNCRESKIECDCNYLN